MSETQELQEPQEPGPVLLERARHALTEMPDGSWVITRAGPLCERCESCGCGEQADPITIPAMAVQMFRMQQNGDHVSLRQRVKAMMGNV